jgi:O-antigen ligase
VVALGFIQSVEYVLHGDEAMRTAPIVNANNFAALANICLPPLLIFAVVQLRPFRDGPLFTHSGVLMCAGLPVLAASVLVSSSRAGIAISSLTLGTTGLYAFFAARHRRRTRSASILWAAPLLVVIAGVILAYGMGDQRIRSNANAFGRTGNDLVIRLAAYRTAVVKMLPERPFFGFGAGTFAAAYPYFRDPANIGHFRYAHNDWLQYLVELGLVGFFLLCGLLYASASTFRLRIETAGFAFALAGAGLHALVDFPVHVPALTLIGCIWAASLATGSSEAGTD